MSGREKNIDRIFKDKLRNFNAEPPEEVWEGIREKLYLDRRRKTVFRITRIAAGIAILAALSLTYFITRDSIKDDQIAIDKKVKTESEEKLPESILPGGVLADGAVSERDLPGVKPEEYTAHEVLQPGEFKGTDDITAAAFQGPVLAFVNARSIGRLDFEVPGIDISPSRSIMYDIPLKQEEIAEGKPDEDIYALNIPEEDKKSENRWAIGTQVSPLYSYRNLDVQGEAMDMANYYNQTESGTLAYSGGLNVHYSPARRISLQSGVYYSKYGVSVDQAYSFNYTAESATTSKFYSVHYSSGVIDIADDPSVDYVTNFGERKDHNTSSGSVHEYSMLVNSGEVIQNFEYIEVPLVLRYRLIDRKIGFNFLGGLSTNLLISSNTYYNDNGDKEKIGETTDIKPFSYSSIMGIGIDYAISKRLYINLEPTFRYYLNSINESSYIGSHPYSLGVFTGLRYSF